MERVEFVERFTQARPGRVLELGCSTGEFLQVMSQRGWDAWGVDLSASAIELCQQLHPDIRVAVGTEPAHHDGMVPGPFDLVAAFHVIEHVPDLASLLVSLKKWCRPGGLLYFYVPNWDSWSRRFLGEHWPDLMEEHVHHFSRSSMTKWLVEGGFEPIHFETASASWHWLGGLKRKFGSRKDVTESTAESARPSGRAMRLLEVADVMLWPVSRVERWMGTGSELRIVAHCSG